MIQLVIEITEEDYNNIEPFLNGETIKGGFNLFKALEIIKNGKPLPKGHGRLIDADVLDRDLENVKVNLGDDLSEAFDDGLTWASEVLNNAQPIIEADKAESEDKG